MNEAGSAPPPEIPAQLFECLRQSTLMVWYRADLSSTALWCPSAFLTPLGYAPGELRPNLEEYFARVHPEDTAALRLRLKELQADTEAHSSEIDFRMRRADGRYVWVRTWLSVGRQPTGEPGCMLAIARLIPEAQRLERARQGPQVDALHAVMNQVGHPVVLMSAGGVVVQANEAAARAAGVVPELPVGEACPFLHAPGLPEQALAAFDAAIATAAPQRLELWRFDRWWDLHLVPIPNACGIVEQVLLLASDVSELKELEQRRLESERELTRTLVREVHHRIKNHLQGLVGLLRLLQGQRLSAAEVIERAIRQVHSIATVHGLLARCPGEGVDLEVILEETVRLIQRDRPHDLRFDLDIERHVTADLEPDDAVAVALVIGELVMNAAKHTPPGPAAFVSIALRAADERTLEIVVHNGPASLPPEPPTGPRQRTRGGLELIQSLLPSGSSHFELRTEGDGVTARLRLQRTGAARRRA